MKRCLKCGIEKEVKEFNKCKNKDGLRNQCRACNKKYYEDNKEEILAQQKEYYEDHKEEKSQYQEEHKEQIVVRMKQYYEDNKDEILTYNRQHYEDHREELLVHQKQYNEEHVEERKAYREEHKEERAAYDKQWYEDHREEKLAYCKQRQKDNPDKYNVKQNNRRAKKKGNGGTHTAQEWASLKEECNYTCLCCGRQEPEIRLTEDHIFPVSKGGTSNIDNIQPLCRSCNSSKRTKTIDYRTKKE